MLEKTIERYLVKRITELGGEVRKIQFIGRRGAPDRLVMMPMWTCWIELKAPGQKAKPHQVREHTRMQRMGQDVRVIDSIEAVDALIAGVTV